MDEDFVDAEYDDNEHSPRTEPAPKVEGKTPRSSWRTISVGAVAASVILVGILHYHSQAEKARSETKQATERLVALERSISSFGAAQNAIVDWRKDLPKENLLAPDTAQLERIFIRADKRPILVIADVLDVSGQGDHYLCLFQTDGGLDWQIELSLQCSPGLAQQVMQQRRAVSVFRRYAVAGEILSVGRLEERPEVTSKGEDEDKTRFLVTGRCVDLLFVGDYMGHYWDYLSDIGTGH